jgi:hypothetical protein
MAKPKITAHYQGTIGGQLRHVPAMTRRTPSSLALSALSLAMALLFLPYVYLTMVGLALSFAFLSGYYIVPFAWLTMRRNRWLFDAPVDLAASEQGLELHTPTGSRKIPWEAVKHVREMKDVFAVMFRLGGGYCIPKSALKDDDLSDFRELAADKVPMRQG